MSQSEIYTFRTFIRSLRCFFFLSRREDQFVVFFPLFSSSRGARGHAVVMVNDPFSDLPFYGSEESVGSEITNPFLDSPLKTHHMFAFFAGVG